MLLVSSILHLSTLSISFLFSFRFFFYFLNLLFCVNLLNTTYIFPVISLLPLLIIISSILSFLSQPIPSLYFGFLLINFLWSLFHLSHPISFPYLPFSSFLSSFLLSLPHALTRLFIPSFIPSLCTFFHNFSLPSPSSSFPYPISCLTSLFHPSSSPVALSLQSER